MERGPCPHAAYADGRQYSDFLVGAMSEQWDQIQELYLEALSMPEAERLTWLREACSDVPDILGQVEAMLQADAATLKLDKDLVARATLGLDEGSVVGPYRLVKPLGHGGMGSVWLAEHADGALDRKVALKLLRIPLQLAEGTTLQRRFEAERRILSRLEHPGIVRLLEAGTASDGRSFFAMDYVDGVRITEFADRRGLARDARLRLFRQVCDAIHHAHQRLVIHRDLKPSNILVTDSAGDTPRVKLLDFGIATLLEDDADADLPLTETGLRPMTRAYAAPEQLRGEPATTATDVYALGLILFELMTGSRPFTATTPLQLEQRILEGNPPSACESIRDGHGHVQKRELAGDVDAIVSQALRTEPERRYASVEAFSADVLRLLDGRPVKARPPSALYRARSFARRNRAGVGLALVALAGLIGFTMLLARQRSLAIQERNTAQATAQFLEDLFASADPFGRERLDTLRIVDLLDRGVERIQTDFADEPLIRGRLLGTIGRAMYQARANDKAEFPLAESARLLREHSDPSGHARSLYLLGSIESVRFELDSAEVKLRRALQVARDVEDQSLVARIERSLAMTLQRADRQAEAEGILRRSLDELLTRGNADEVSLASAERAIATVLVDLGHVDESISHFESALERLTKTYGI